MAHRKHKEVIEAWLNGAQVQYKDCAGQWEDSEQDQAGFFGHLEYRIKPAEPERAMVETKMTNSELFEAAEKRNGARSAVYDFRDLANAVLAHACDAGQIVTREEFDRAVEDLKSQHLIIARAIVEEFYEDCSKVTDADLLEILSSLK